jgi:hypothetical protein
MLKYINSLFFKLIQIEKRKFKLGFLKSIYYICLRHLN